MFETTTLFYWVATVELISLVVLSVGVALVYFLPRPIERLRTIQATLGASPGLSAASRARAAAGVAWLAGRLDGSRNAARQHSAFATRRRSRQRYNYLPRLRHSVHCRAAGACAGAERPVRTEPAADVVGRRGR